jgi:predicted ester cyclase
VSGEGERENARRNAETIRAGIGWWNSPTDSEPPDAFADDIVIRSPKLPAPGVPDTYHGREGARELWGHLHTAYPDFHLELYDVIAEGDRAASHFRINGTNTGEWFGIPPTGRSVSFEEVGIYRFENGQIREIRLIFDMMDLGRQLGMVPDGPPPRAFMLLMNIATKIRRIRGRT